MAHIYSIDINETFKLTWGQGHKAKSGQDGLTQWHDADVDLTWTKNALLNLFLQLSAILLLYKPVTSLVTSYLLCIFVPLE